MTETDLPARSRERVNEWLADMRERYGAFERAEKRWELAPGGYEASRDRIVDGANGGAGIWATDDDGRVLLARNEGDEGWADPGGKRERDESFEAAARREVREETGVDCEITGLREVHVLELADETDSGRPTLASLIAVFDGVRVGGTPRPREGEIAEVGWFERCPDAVLYPEVADRPIPASE